MHTTHIKLHQATSSYYVILSHNLRLFAVKTRLFYAKCRRFYFYLIGVGAIPHMDEKGICAFVFIPAGRLKSPPIDMYSWSKSIAGDFNRPADATTMSVYSVSIDMKIRTLFQNKHLQS